MTAHMTGLFKVIKGLTIQLSTESLLNKFTGETPKMTIPHQGLAEEDKSLALTREVNLDTQSSDNSTEEMSESERSFQSLIACGKEAFLIGILTSRGNLKDH